MFKAAWQYLKYLLRGSSAPDEHSFDFIVKGMRVFDVGANRGNYSDLFSRKGAHVIAVEPQPDCIHFLKMRFAFRSNVRIVPKGAGAQAGKQTFYISTADATSSMNEKWINKVQETKRFDNWNVAWKKPITVELTTLDTLIQKFGQPDYVKIDVEGFETEVLRGLSKPVQHISFEYTLPEMKTEAITCVNLLGSLGNYVFRSELRTTKEYISREEILTEIEQMSRDGGLHNGDIFARLQ